MLVNYPAGLAAVAYTIPDGILIIGDNAFYGCDNLAIIFIPDGVTSIGDGAFTGCSKLTRIIIPDSVTSIGASPFCVCTQLQAIHVFPDHPVFTTIDGVLFKKAEKCWFVIQAVCQQRNMRFRMGPSPSEKARLPVATV